ncbi:putative O-glycosylation ligase, exosortase A system-associated [Rheinheimera sp.]|uniref:putative O-glycosylation ligase, exosortase A system-associated n=1 Tax=Rheinheimera sp. TaxID=1869214 RepID=UPI0040472425
MRDLLLVAFFILTIYFTFKRPFIGVCSWVWIAMMAPTSWAFGFSTQLRLNLTIVIITFLAFVFAEKNKQFRIGTLGRLILLFCIWTLISSIAHITFNSDDVWRRFSDFLKVVALFYFATLLLKRKVHLDTFIWSLVLSVSAYAAMEAFKFILSGGGHEVTGRAGVIADRNDFAVALNMCIPLMVYLISVTKHKYLRYGLIVLILLNVVSIIGTYSRGGFIGLSILAIAFWWRSRYKLPLALLFMLLIPIGYSLAPAEWKERQSTVATAATEDASFIGRLWAWKISTLIALDNPMTGGGFRAVIDQLVWNQYAGQTPDFGPIATPPIPITEPAKAAHNIYFQVLGDHGFVGLFIFLAILLYAYRQNNVMTKRMRKAEVGWASTLCSSLNLSIIAYCITGANVSLAYFDLSFAIFAIVNVLILNRDSLIQQHQAASQQVASDDTAQRPARA